VCAMYRRRQEGRLVCLPPPPQPQAPSLTTLNTFTRLFEAPLAQAQREGGAQEVSRRQGACVPSAQEVFRRQGACVRGSKAERGAPVCLPPPPQPQAPSLRTLYTSTTLSEACPRRERGAQEVFERQRACMAPPHEKFERESFVEGFHAGVRARPIITRRAASHEQEAMRLSRRVLLCCCAGRQAGAPQQPQQASRRQAVSSRRRRQEEGEANNNNNNKFCF
jgi:hypothetical protein